VLALAGVAPDPANNGSGDGQAVPTGRQIGEPAPPLKLPDLDGQIVDLADFRGEKTLVLFWNPGCGFCQQMLPDLKEWEQNPPEEAPNLLVVSTGTKEAKREMGLSSTVVLDQQFAVGQSFGAGGTPSAVLVDEEGNIASELAVGAPAVLALAGGRQTEVQYLLGASRERGRLRMPLGGAELLLLLVIILLFFGAKRVPKLARSLGTGARAQEGGFGGRRRRERDEGDLGERPV
jgi:TatA/E family protein of Tat protein translocase